MQEEMEELRELAREIASIDMGLEAIENRAKELRKRRAKLYRDIARSTAIRYKLREVWGVVWNMVEEEKKKLRIRGR